MSLFDSTALDTAVHQALVGVPSGHTNAVVGTVDKTGAEIIVAVQRDINGVSWQVQGAYSHQWASGDDQIAGRVLVSW